MMYVREILACKQCQDLEISGLEARWVEIIGKSRKILTGAFIDREIVQ